MRSGNSPSNGWRGLSLIALTLALSACNVGPDFKVPDIAAPESWFDFHTKAPVPAKSAASVPVAEAIDTRWWDAFGDPTLSDLERRAVTANLDVKTASIRFAESRAQRGIAASDQFPTLNGNASYTREQASGKGLFGALSGGPASSLAGGAGGGGSAGGAGGGVGGLPGSFLKPFSLFQYGFDASWEIDLWGHARREVESADASVAASVEAQKDMLVSVMAEIARDYIQLRGTQRSLAVTRDDRAAASENLSLTEQRAAGGMTTDLDAANARTLLSGIDAQITQLTQQEAQSINRLSLLLGAQPGALAAELTAVKPVPPVPPRVPIGLPSELARRRPDIKRAEAQLHSATADIGVAVAEFYPRITLSGSAGLQALQFKDLANWGALQYALGPNLTVPLFEGGKLTATLELRKQQQQEAAIAYQSAVLNAWHEVDNAMIAYDAEQHRRDQLDRATQSARQAVELAERRYQSGISDFLPVLDARRTLLQEEQQYADSTTLVSTNLVALYKALGGGWETTAETSDNAVGAHLADAK